MTGKSATSSEIAVAGLAGAAGGAAGAKIGLSVLDKVNKLAAKSGVAGHIGATTRDAMQLGGKIAEPATSMGQKTGQRAADTTSSYAEKKINE
jgi:hypothetical protein